MIKKINLLEFTLIITIIFLVVKIFIISKLYPAHDEIITFDRYLNWHKFFRRDTPNNHFLLSFLGTISNQIFGFNFYILRFISFLSLVGIFYIYSKIFKNYLILTLFLTTIFSSQIILNFSYLFRGYYLSSFICTLIFYYLNKYFYKKKIKHIEKIFFFNFLLAIHSLYTLYIVIPILISLSILLIKEKKKLILLNKSINYFVAPTIFIYLISIIVTGFSNEFSNNLNIKFLLNNTVTVLENSFIPGFRSIFLNDYIQPDSLLKISRTETILYFYKLYSSNSILFLIFFLSFLLSVTKLILKKIDVFDLSIFFFIFFFILLNKKPYERIYVGFVYYFLFYIVLNLEKLLVKFTLKKNFKRYANILCTIIIIFLLRNIKIEPISDEWSLQNEVTIINIYKNNCDLANNKLDQYKIWILINFYPKQCYYYYDEKMKINILSNNKINSFYKYK